MASRRYRLLLGLMLAQGCCHPYQDQTGLVVQQLAEQIRDLEPVEPGPPVEQAPTPRTTADTKGTSANPPQEPGCLGSDTTAGRSLEGGCWPQLEVPGRSKQARCPPIRLPREEKAQTGAETALSAAGTAAPEMPLAMGPEGRPLALADLQKLAAANNPSIRNAVAAIEAARGVRAGRGLSRIEPLVGSRHGGHRFGRLSGRRLRSTHQGLEQAQAAASGQLSWTCAAPRWPCTAPLDLATPVRSNYFAVLVATARTSRSAAWRAGGIHRQALRHAARPGLGRRGRFLRTDAASPHRAAGAFQPLAGHEPGPRLLEADDLAVALGMPDVPPTELLGRVDLPIPVFDYDHVLSHVLAQHTDVVTSQNSILKSPYQLELAKVTPYPDFDIHVLLQKDTTTPPRTFVYSAALSFPVPVWTRTWAVSSKRTTCWCKPPCRPSRSACSLPTPWQTPSIGM